MSFHPAMPYGTERWHRSERQTLPEGPEFVFTPERRAEFERLAAMYPPEHRRSSVLYALYLAQDQQGYITGNAARHVAEVVGITTADVEDVVSYYVMFHRNPVGQVRPAGVHDAVVRAGRGRAGGRADERDPRRQAR